MFGDPRLQALIALALRNNRDLRIVALNVEVARAQYRIQRADLLPTANAIAVGSRRGGAASSLAAGAAGAGAAGAAGAGTAGAGTAGSGTGGAPAGSAAGGASSGGFASTFYQLGVSASYELDLFGRVRSLSKAALERYLGSIEAYRAAHLALVGEVVTQYLSERNYAEQYAIAVGNEAATRATYDLTRRLFEAGQRSELDMRAAEAQWRNAQGEVPRIWRLWAQAVNALVLLVGQPLPADLPPPQALAGQHVVADLAPGLPSDVLLRRPDVLEAEHALRAANANIGAARAAFFPRISLTGFAGTISTSLAALFSGGGAWTFTPSATLPLFTGGANIANLDLARAEKRIEVARYERAIQGAFREVADALVAREMYERELAAQLAQVRANQIRFELSMQRYRAGIDDYLSVLDSQGALYVSQQVLIALRTARLTNLADLYRALGGGWRE